MEKVKIYLGGGVIDCEVDKTKFESYKTENGKLSFVRNTVCKVCESLTGYIHNGIEFRKVFISNNNLYGETKAIDQLCIINDLGYSINNPLHKNENKLVIRFVHVEIVGVIVDEKEYKKSGGFGWIYNEKYHLGIAFNTIV